MWFLILMQCGMGPNCQLITVPKPFLTFDQCQYSGTVNMYDGKGGEPNARQFAIYEPGAGYRYIPGTSGYHCVQYVQETGR